MKIKNENIILRDMIESDIDDYVRWFTTETEWSNTDAPWESIESDEETERKSWREYYESVKDLADDVRRWKFEIERNGRHIGWVLSLIHISEPTRQAEISYAVFCLKKKKKKNKKRSDTHNKTTVDKTRP